MHKKFIAFSYNTNIAFPHTIVFPHNTIVFPHNTIITFPRKTIAFSHNTIAFTCNTRNSKRFKEFKKGWEPFILDW